MNQDIRNALPSGYRLEEYEVESVLGHGGFGVTYLARDTRLDTLVAIKEYMPGDLAVREGGSTVHPRSGADRDEFLWGLDRFLSEARTLARFKHPNIVSVLRFFEDNGTAYLVMEYEEGDSLSEVLRRKKILKESELWPILIPLLDGLAQVHDAGFLHRDIKPGNVFIRADGSPVLIDFGAARQAIGQKSKSLTAIVTAGYAPVEQYGTGGEQGAWTDIYALAGVLYRAVTGAPPPASPDRATAILRGNADPMVPATTAGKGQCSAKVLAAIDKGLGVLETDRPQSVGDWQTLLFGGRAPPAVTGAPARHGRSAFLGVIGGVLMTVLLFGGGYAAWQMMQDTGEGGGEAGGNQPLTQQAQVPSDGTAGGTSGDGQASSGDAAISADAIQRAEADAKAREEEAAKRRAEEQARQKAAEEAQAKAKAEAEAKAEAKRQAEVEARKKADTDAQQNREMKGRRMAEMSRAKAAAEAKREADEAARKKAEAAASKLKAQEAARRAAAAEAERKAAAEARAKAELEARRKGEEEARKTATADARRKAEAVAAAKRKAEDAARKQAETEAKRQAALEARFAELERRAKEAEARAKAAERAAKSSAGSPTQTARIPDPSTPDGLKALFAGTRVTAARSGFFGELLYRVDFSGDGSVHGGSLNQGVHTEEADTGKWTVEAGKLCVQWAKWDDGEKRCYTITGKKNPYAASGAAGIFKGELFINR